MPLIDLTGQTLGRWTIVSRADNLYERHVAWHCVCACGNERVVAAKALRSGASTSCGCAKIEKAKGRRVDLTGRTFGRLTVIRGRGEGRGHRWVCACSCGNATEASAHLLTSGATRSCGCLARELIARRNRDSRKDRPGYNAAHARVRKARGLAAKHLCVDCDKPAAEWSYDHSDPDELVDRGLPYSTNTSHYAPRCVPCHRQFDRLCGDVVRDGNHHTHAACCGGPLSGEAP